LANNGNHWWPSSKARGNCTDSKKGRDKAMNKIELSKLRNRLKMKRNKLKL
jgi:hypothetical protein